MVEFASDYNNNDTVLIFIHVLQSSASAGRVNQWVSVAFVSNEK
jgi:hypothetical protein